MIYIMNLVLVDEIDSSDSNKLSNRPLQTLWTPGLLCHLKAARNQYLATECARKLEPEISLLIWWTISCPEL